MCHAFEINYLDAEHAAPLAAYTWHTALRCRMTSMLQADTRAHLTSRQLDLFSSTPHRVCMNI